MQSASIKRAGFTIVELLIVIVVIAILAAISLVVYSGVQDRARQAKAASDIRSIISAIQLARINTGKSLRYITGSTWSPDPCDQKPGGTDLGALPDNDPCIVAYNNTLEIIATAAGVNLDTNMRDPWGWPYRIDENEGEFGAGDCTKDSVVMWARPLNFDEPHPWTPEHNVPLGGMQGC